MDLVICLFLSFAYLLSSNHEFNIRNDVLHHLILLMGFQLFGPCLELGVVLS